MLRQIGAGGAGCAVAGFVTNPCDVVKIRNQQYGGAKYGSFSGTFQTVFAEEGLQGLLRGVKASVYREATYSGVRMGMYEPFKQLYSNFADPNGAAVKWASAFSSGALGSAIFNPLDLVKVRFQSTLPDGSLPGQGSVWRTLRDIYATEGGVRGWYVGTSATVARAAFLTSAQLGTYDIIKNNVLVSHFGFVKEKNATHLLASLITSIVATTAANPADVVKTRVMNMKVAEHGECRSPSMVAMKILRQEGIMTFMRGWIASYCRIGPHTVISFVLIEEFRKLIGLQTY